MNFDQITLESERIRLEPLAEKHLADWREIAFTPALWRFTVTQINSDADLQAYFQKAVELRAKKIDLPFAVIDKNSGKAVGSTRFHAVDFENLTCEIGWTWVAENFQRSYVNTEAKFLLLKYAFETWKMRRVEFIIHEKNTKSRNAVERLGAKFEGILRKHLIMQDGTPRNSAVYSIIDDEWHDVKKHLEEKMEQTYK